jgi:hypothetical protein
MLEGGSRVGIGFWVKLAAGVRVRASSRAAQAKDLLAAFTTIDALHRARDRIRGQQRAVLTHCGLHDVTIERAAVELSQKV